MENTITLSHEQKKLVEEKVQSGSYTSEREVVGAGLRLLDGVNPTWMTPGAIRKKVVVIHQVAKGLFVLLSLRVYSFWQGIALR